MSGPSRFSHKVCFGEFELNLETAELRTNGSKAILPGQPFQVLVTLLNRPGQLVTREELKKQLWSSNTFVDFDQSLNKAVNRLRESLNDSAEDPRFIETLPRKGYRFIGIVQSGGLDKDIEGSTNLLARSESPVADVHVAADRASGHGFLFSRGQGPGTSLQVRRYVPAPMVAILGISAVAFVIFQSVSRPHKLDLNNVQITKLTESGRVQGVAISPDGRYIVYPVRNGEAESLRLHEVSTQSDIEILPSGPGFHGLTFSPDGSQIYIVRSDEKDPFFKYLYSMPVPGGGSVRKLISDVDSAISFSPDGREFVYEHCLQPRNDIELKIRHTDGTDDRVLATLHDASGFLFQPGPSWSPDGQTIAVPALLVGNQQRWVLYAVSVKDGAIWELYSSPDYIGRPVWLPNHEALVSPHYDRDARRSQLWTISFPNGEARQMTHDLTDYGTDLGITRDGRAIAATTGAITSNVWTVPVADPTNAEQITFSGIPILKVVEAFDGKLLTLGADGVPWMMVADGTQRTKFAEFHNASSVTPCGRFLIVLLDEPGTTALVRVNRDGTHVTRLASGHLWGPVCSNDGQFVFYNTTEQPQKIWRVSTELGGPEEVADVLGNQVTGRLAVSPDGTLLAYPYTRYGRVPSDGWKVAIIPATGGVPVHILPLSGNAEDLHWSPDGRSLQYILTSPSATNIWEQPLSGGKPKRLTKFTSGGIFSFNWSSDHQRLLLTRGDVTSDVVLLSNLH